MTDGLTLMNETDKAVAFVDGLSRYNIDGLTPFMVAVLDAAVAKDLANNHQIKAMVAAECHERERMYGL